MEENVCPIQFEAARNASERLDTARIASEVWSSTSTARIDPVKPKDFASTSAKSARDAQVEYRLSLNDVVKLEPKPRPATIEDRVNRVIGLVSGDEDRSGLGLRFSAEREDRITQLEQRQNKPLKGMSVFLEYKFKF